MLDVCYDPTSKNDCTAMVGTGNDCQHTAYMSLHGNLCYCGLFRGSVVPAKFLLVSINTLFAEGE